MNRAAPPWKSISVFLLLEVRWRVRPHDWACSKVECSESEQLCSLHLTVINPSDKFLGKCRWHVFTTPLTPISKTDNLHNTTHCRASVDCDCSPQRRANFSILIIATKTITVIRYPKWISVDFELGNISSMEVETVKECPTTDIGYRLLVLSHFPRIFPVSCSANQRSIQNNYHSHAIGKFPLPDWL